MPELPEVETIATDLDQVLCHQVISDITLISSGKILKTPLSQFKKKLQGVRISRVFRRAKMLVIETSAGLIVIHLKMTGQLVYVSKKKVIAGGHPIQSTGLRVPNQFTHLVFSFTKGNILYFNDVRKFGWVILVTPEEFADMSRSVGLEPLGTDFTLDFFKNMLNRRSKTTIKAVLLDQKHLAGLGNIYVDEVLFRSGVRPSRIVGSITNQEIKKIWQAIPVVLRHSIKERGTTFSNFIDTSGLRGNFMKYLRVYGRAGQPCVVCGRPLRKTRVAGRGTHWCEKCQK